MRKLSNRRKVGISLVVLLSGLLTILLFQISAASGSITVTPSKRTLTQGQTFTAVVTVDVDSPITIAQASIAYDPNVLQLSKDIDYGNSPMTSDTPESTNSPGNLVISRYKVGDPYPSGKFTLATLTFTSKTSGNTAISLNTNNSSLFEATLSSPNILTQASGTTVSITAPPTTNPKPPSQPQSPPTTNNSSQSSNQSGSSSSNIQRNIARNNDDIGSNQDIPEDDDAQPAAITEEIPSNTLPEPGTSRIASDPSLATQLTQIVKNIAPIILLLGIAGLIGWVISKRINKHSSFGGYKPVQASGPGVVFDGSHTVKTNQDNNNQPPSPVQ